MNQELLPISGIRAWLFAITPVVLAFCNSAPCIVCGLLAARLLTHFPQSADYMHWCMPGCSNALLNPIHPLREVIMPVIVPAITLTCSAMAFCHLVRHSVVCAACYVMRTVECCEL